jgi:queuine/archaeosine tRNA-ribosyltransferase
MKKKINRGFVVETNFSPCRCYDKGKYNVMDDDAVDLEHFQWMSEYDHKQVVSFFDKQGACPTCEEDITFDQHWIVTHQEEEKEKIFSVGNIMMLQAIEDAIHFKCNEGDLEDCVHEYIRNNIKDMEWTYEEVSK